MAATTGSARPGTSPSLVQAFKSWRTGSISLLAFSAGVPLGLVIFGTLSDLVSDGIGVGPGWMPLPTAGQLILVTLVALALAGGLGALAVARLARRPAAELVRWE